MISAPTEYDLAIDLPLMADRMKVYNDWSSESESSHSGFPEAMRAAFKRAIYAERTVLVLQDAIRKHRDQGGDNRCWMDDEELYKVLPEGYTPPAREVAVELELCKKFVECRRNPATVYVSPQIEIERLQAENSALREQVAWLEDPTYESVTLKGVGQ